MRRRIALALMSVAVPLVELAGILDEDVATDKTLESMARWCNYKGRPSMSLSVEVADRA